MNRRALFCVAGLVVLVGGCGAGAPVAVGPPGSGESVPTTTTIAVPASDGGGAELDAKALLTSVRSSIGLVTTPMSQGSGVLVDDGYVVTNAHVIDPYASATVTFEGDPPIEEVPVVGVDPYADIALLGPIEVDRAPLALASEVRLDQGDGVYLVGYPGEFDVAPEVAISSGLVSRLRDYAPLEQTYIQTDAAIGGGQSGGALLDARGQVVGISGLRFAEQFALALSGPDVLRSIDLIKRGDTPGYQPLPDKPQWTDGTIDLLSADEVGVLVLNAAPEDRTLNLTVPDGTTVEISDLVGDLHRANQSLIDQAMAQDPSMNLADFGEVLTGSGPGQYQLEVPAGVDATIQLGTTQADGASVTWTSSLPVVAYEDRDDFKPISVGDSVKGVIDAIELADVYELQLDAGQTVTIRVSAGGGDPLFFVVPPGSHLVDVTAVDDSAIGLNGFDAEDTLTVDEAGTYLVVVSMNDGIVTGYRLDVEG